MICATHGFSLQVRHRLESIILLKHSALTETWPRQSNTKHFQTVMYRWDILLVVLLNRSAIVENRAVHGSYHPGYIVIYIARMRHLAFFFHRYKASARKPILSVKLSIHHLMMHSKYAWSDKKSSHNRVEPRCTLHVSEN